MKIYHTKTQEDYDALMEELESDGCVFSNGRKPTKVKLWGVSRADTYVICNSKVLTLSSISWEGQKYPDIPIIEYTAQKSHDNVKDIIESVSENNEELYHKIIQELEQTYLAKNKDYGNSFEQSLDEFGEVAGVVRIGDKFNRAKNLMNNKPKVKDESKIDTWLDMSIYCIMQAMWLMKQEG